MRYKDDEYKQISLNQLNTHGVCNYDALKGKVIDKVAFNNRGERDEQALTIIFTDKTFISVGFGYVDFSSDSDEMQLQDYLVDDPSCYNFSDFGYHVWVDSKGELRFDRWIQILIDLGLWEMTMEEVQSIIEQKTKEKEEHEYQEYLRLKKKFEML